MGKHKGFICLIKEHRKELTIAGVSIGTLILIFFGIKNREMFEMVWASLKKAVKQPTAKTAEAVTKVTLEIPLKPIQEAITTMTSNSETLPFEISRHIRNLPDGWHASPEKIAEARKANIILMNGQTWVKSYTKGGVVA